VLFSEPSSHKVRNIAHPRVVTLHFNSDPGGGDVVVITGEASASDERSMLQFPDYLDKYNDEVTGALGTTADALARTYNVCIRIHPTAYDRRADPSPAM
jgi:PPOX class probable F420-dependent enzyme